MRFDLGTLDTGERSLPFGLHVLLFQCVIVLCEFIVMLFVTLSLRYVSFFHYVMSVRHSVL